MKRFANGHARKKLSFFFFDTGETSSVASLFDG